MYNWWWIIIALGVILLVGLIMGCIKGFWTEPERRWDDPTPKASFFVSIIPAMILIILIPVCASDYVRSKHEVNELLIEKEAIISMYEDRELFDSLSVTERVVEYNNRVANIKATVKTYGKWSPYTFTDYKDLELIIIKKENT